MKAVFLTAGAAGMYCGSCMHDNSLARAMRDQGVDCVLQPIYTPIRTDRRKHGRASSFSSVGSMSIYSNKCLGCVGCPPRFDGPSTGRPCFAWRLDGLMPPMPESLASWPFRC